MYVSVTTLEIDGSAESKEKARHIWAEMIVPRYRRASGFLDVLFCVGSRVPSKALIIGLWESEGAAREFEVSGQFALAIEPLAGIIEGRPVRTVHEVVATTL